MILWVYCTIADYYDPTFVAFSLVNLDRTAYVAKIINLDCRHKMTIYISDEQKYPDLCIAIVAPNHQEPHLHPALPPTKVPRNVRKKYKQCVTAIGVIGATIGQVEHGTFSLFVTYVFDC